ncbi:helix-turn-helix domain-containing protein [Paenibacillus sp. CAA11]|uniref:helix-turn-helix domain-containing protein n=1 Tax=Paenibacillus sp. CAA11 TaxID=1532905 RepID=UPI000D394BA1|nr:helix-turn-helix domain-containing protein [Paenibacillus sp. CAA11]AWB45296.1 helix-turn-helix domain-containing protein [Paenibacillus sp. CAA11]
MSDSKQTGIVRVSKRESGYAVLDTYFLGDTRLSWKAKGMLAYLLSKPSNWTVYTTDLIKRSRDGRDAVYSALKELESCGYVERRQARENGRITGTETVVYERPSGDFSHTDFPDMEVPDTDNPPLVINNINNNDSKEEVSKTRDTRVLTTLTRVLRRLPLNDTASLYDHYFEDIYAMLSRRFGDAIEPDAIQFAAERYFDKAVDMTTGLPRGDVYSPTGLFYDCYVEGLAELKARRFKRCGA